MSVDYRRDNSICQVISRIVLSSVYRWPSLSLTSGKAAVTIGNSHVRVHFSPTIAVEPYREPALFLSGVRCNLFDTPHSNLSLSSYSWPAGRNYPEC